MEMSSPAFPSPIDAGELEVDRRTGSRPLRDLRLGKSTARVAGDLRWLGLQAIFPFTIFPFAIFDWKSTARVAGDLFLRDRRLGLQAIFPFAIFDWKSSPLRFRPLRDFDDRRTLTGEDDAGETWGRRRRRWGRRRRR
ncbi:hypothetical protein U1Q18_030589 [Sarracenia purpurea var. burkii]